MGVAMRWCRALAGKAAVAAAMAATVAARAGVRPQVRPSARSPDSSLVPRRSCPGLGSGGGGTRSTATLGPLRQHQQHDTAGWQMCRTCATHCSLSSLLSKGHPVPRCGLWECAGSDWRAGAPSSSAGRSWDGGVQAPSSIPLGWRLPSRTSRRSVPSP